MLDRFLDDRYDAHVRRNLSLLTAARLAANGVIRFAPPFLATIAKGFDVDLSTMGAAMAIAEFAGLLGIFIGPVSSRWRRRTSMVVGLSVLAVGALGVAVAPRPWAMGLSLLVSVAAKILFDVALNAWFADRVPYELRGRIIGVSEVSWAGGLLVAVPLMAVVLVLTNFRGAYAVAALAVAVFAVALVRHLPDEAAPSAAATRASLRGVPRAAFHSAAAVLCLSGASQACFLTFGSWLEDRFGVRELGLAAVVFGLGLVELTATTLTARLTDRWGKARSVIRGAIVMVPVAIAMGTALGEHLATGLTLLAVFLLGFEFAIVSSISFASNAVPGNPSVGLGLNMSFSTIGRFAVSFPATALYEAHGFGSSMLLAAALAAASIAAMTAADRSRLRPRPQEMRG